jgi:23S rRNA (cytidine1920-2'-O)/16S rRNA (cytidine1409-2'-O)-methyltransferase
MDRTNARSLQSLPEPIDLVSIDVSFIGLRLVLPAARSLLDEGGRIVALVKPQFEAGRALVGRGGVVRDPDVHRRVLEGLFQTAADLGLGVLGLTASPLRGPAGNVEFLALLAADEPSVAANAAIARALAEAPMA